MLRLSPRSFILPVLALVVIGSLPAPAQTGRNGGGCGPALASFTDPGQHAVFARIERTQSAAAARVCAIYRNSLDAAAR